VRTQRREVRELQHQHPARHQRLVAPPRELDPARLVQVLDQVGLAPWRPALDPPSYFAQPAATESLMALIAALPCARARFSS
jgi:hypothetical protein